MCSRKRVLSIILSLVMVFSFVPAVTYASGANDSTISVKAQSDWKDYVEASVTDTSGRIGQNGTTNVRVYFFHGAENESVNGGVPTTAPENAYANQYGFKYDVKTDISVIDYWDNYILNKLDTTKEIKFGFFMSGSQTAHGSHDYSLTYVIPYIDLKDAEGNVVATGTEMFDRIENPSLGGAGGGTGGGPNRGFDILLTIPANTLEPIKDYYLELRSGMSASGRTQMDKRIVFNFETAPIKVTNVNLNSNEVVLSEGGSKTLSTKITPANATYKNITWTSSDSGKVRVDKNGKIKAVKGGSATITANTKDGVKSTCKVRVIGTSKVKATSKTHNSIKLTWKKAANADGYKVYRYNSKTKKYKLIKTTRKRSYTHKKLKTGSKYSYKVRAYKVVNGKKIYGKFSTKDSAKVKLPAPKVKLKKNGTSIKATVTKVEGARGFVVYRTTAKSDGFFKIKTLAKGKYAFTSYNKIKGKTYYYKVKAFKIVDGKKVYSSYSKITKIKL